LAWRGGRSCRQEFLAQPRKLHFAHFAATAEQIALRDKVSGRFHAGVCSAVCSNGDEKAGTPNRCEREAFLNSTVSSRMMSPFSTLFLLICIPLFHFFRELYRLLCFMFLLFLTLPRTLQWPPSVPQVPPKIHNLNGCPSLSQHEEEFPSTLQE
jgi:hypothetical protein